jgi:hypothetical protein
MENRAFERIPVDFEIRLPFGNMFYSGKVLNLSERGMFISTKRSYPLDSVLTIQIEKETVYLLAKVRSFKITDGNLEGVGVEILNPPQNYLEFVSSLKASLYN